MPGPTTYQSQMDIHMGKMPSVDDNYQIDNIAMKFNVAAKTADHTCLVSESGTMFTTEAAAADIEFTLPAVADAEGVIYWFYASEDYELLVTAPADTLVAFHNAVADGITYTTTGAHIGNAFMMVCNGTKWHSCCMTGDPATIITVVSA